MSPVTPSHGTGVVALGFAPASRPVLHRLEQAGLTALIRWPLATPHSGSDLTGRDWLRQQWPGAKAVVIVGACGLATRLIAPLLREKHQDPAVVVVDPLGRFAIPLLGGHAAGAERLSQEIAALLGGQAVLTGSGAALGRLALDAFGKDWGWCRGEGDWSGLMARWVVEGSGTQPLRVFQDCGEPQWRSLAGADGLELVREDPMDPFSAEVPVPSPAEIPLAGPSLLITHRTGAGCRWHPPCLWLGIGCERHTSGSLLERLVDRTLARHGLAGAAVAGAASIDRKKDEIALRDLCLRRGWTLRLFSAAELAEVEVPNPSGSVEREMGTPSVAEASALRAAALASASGRGLPGRLLLEKTIERAHSGERGAATLAVALARCQWAPDRGELHLVGSGPGRIDLLTADVQRILARATVWVGYTPYLDLLESLRRPDQLRLEGRLTEERARCALALQLARQGLKVALISSGDSGIYGMAGLGMELWLDLPAEDRPTLEVHPGLSALQLAAAKGGAPLMHDFCAISLSDRLTPWETIEGRLGAAAAADFVVALYNPRSRERHWQLKRALELLREFRPPSTPVLLARQLGRTGERVVLHTLADLPVESVDMLTLLLIGNRSTFIRDGRMVTPRGYRT